MDSEIVDVESLAELRNLENLVLSENKIVNVKPLARLRKLTHLELNGSQLAVKVCPVKPDSICKF